MENHPDDLLRGAKYISRGIGLFLRKTALWREAAMPLLVSAAVYLPLMCVCLYLRARMIAYLKEECGKLLHIKIEFLNNLVTSIVFGEIVSMTLGFAVFVFFSVTLLSWRFSGERFCDLVPERDGTPYAMPKRPKGGSFRTVSALFWLVYFFNTLVLVLLLFVLMAWLPILGQLIALSAAGYRFGVMILATIGCGRGLHIWEIQRLARKHIAAVAGLGLGAYFVQLFPFAGLILLPGTISGAALFFRDYRFDAPKSN